MRNARRGGLQLLALAALGVVAWFALAPLRNARQVTPSLAQPSAERVARDPDLGELESTTATRVSDPAREEIAAPVESQPAAPVAETPISLSIHGFVLPAEGRVALTEAPFLTLTDRRGEQRRIQGGPDGAYSFAGLFEGSHWICAGSFHDGEARAVVELESSAPENRLDLRLVLPYEVLVKLVDGAGEALVPLDRFLIAVATLQPPGPWFDEFRGSSNERFGVGNFWDDNFFPEKLPLGYLGRVRLLVEPPVYLSLLHCQYVVETKRVEKGQREVEFVVARERPAMRTGGLQFHFVAAETGEFLRIGSASLDGASGSRNVRSDQGFFQIGGLAPGWYEIRMMFEEGFERFRRRVRVEPGADLDLGELALARETWVAGQVVDESGNGSGVRLDIQDIDPVSCRGVRPAVLERHGSQGDGSFRIGSLSPGIHILKVRERDGPWAQASMLVDTSSGPVEDLRIELVRGVPLVLRGSDEGWFSVHYTIFDAGGVEVVSSRLWSAAPWRILLAPGRYEVESRLAEDGEPVRRIPITIEDEVVELALP